MKRKKGPVETFSVSVDAKTKKVLKAHADRLFDGNMSAMISAFGREAEKRDAIHWLVQDAGGSALTDALREELSTEFHGTKKRKKPAA
ncbi:MAG: hypothetical protein FWD73_01055 [Polyangiaceae bacterium]|nr:hypothetical protein [Polyangiaceae bacterium]